MPDDFMRGDLSQLSMPRRPTTERPLQGLTVLVVEDSRFASEAMRLLCLRSGARIRRADTLYSARRHLSLYRPSTVIVDLGLPDGNGLDLIAEVARAVPRVPVLLGCSGDSALEPEAMAAGAQGFLLKPITELARFQQAILTNLPDGMGLAGPRVLPSDCVRPDRLALRDDLAQLLELVTAPGDAAALAYAAQFLGSVARSAEDSELAGAAAGLAELAGRDRQPEGLGRIASLVQHRIQTAQAM